MGYGWRGRIGLLVPSSNTTMESEFWRMSPQGVSIHVARMRLTSHTVQDNINMEKDAVKAAADLTTAKVNVIIFGCTSGSFIGGPDWEAKLTHALKEETGLPAITTTRAVIEGLRVLNATRIVVATPYPEEINRKEKTFLERMGFNLLSIKGLGIYDNVEVGLQTPETAYRLVKEIFMPKADGVFISCTNFRTIEIIEALELDLMRPVITSTQASMWAALRELRVRDKISGFGKLLREHL